MELKLGIIILLIACRPWTDLQPQPFGFLMSKIRVLQRLLHGMVSSSLIKSVFGESPRIASGFRIVRQFRQEFGILFGFFIDSALLILPVSLEEDAYTHTGIQALPRVKGFHTFRVSVASVLAESRTPQVQGDHKILRSFYLLS